MTKIILIGMGTTFSPRIAGAGYFITGLLLILIGAARLYWDITLLLGFLFLPVGVFSLLMASYGYSKRSPMAPRFGLFPDHLEFRPRLLGNTEYFDWEHIHEIQFSTQMILLKFKNQEEVLFYRTTPGVIAQINEAFSSFAEKKDILYHR